MRALRICCAWPEAVMKATNVATVSELSALVDGGGREGDVVGIVLYG
jgi:hypothetical protein